MEDVHGPVLPARIASGFNGATAVTPWKTRCSDATDGTVFIWLQWGHGGDAVETDLSEPGCADHAVASMGPRR